MIQSLNRIIITLIITNITAAFFVQKNPRFYNNNLKADETYNMYIFATEWAGSACIFKTCINWPLENVFNIHGLWPSNIGWSPEKCGGKPFEYDETNIDQRFIKTLYQYWSGCYTANWEFVKYELAKHGTCWNRLLNDKNLTDKEITKIIGEFDPRDIFGMFNTFLKVTVYLSKKMDPFGTLKARGIIPTDSGTYKISEIVKIFNEKYKLINSVIPICKRDKKLGITVILELRFCLDLNYSTIECDPMVVERNIQNCGEEGINYPLLNKMSIDTSSD